MGNQAGSTHRAIVAAIAEAAQELAAVDAEGVSSKPTSINARSAPRSDSFQHSATARALPAVCTQLSLPYPLPAWGETWDRIRVRVTEALGVMREAIRRYADSEKGAT